MHFTHRPGLPIGEVNACPGVCQRAARTRMLRRYSSVPRHVWLSHIQLSVMGTSWSGAMGRFRQPGPLVSQSLSPELLGVTALRITTGCFALAWQLAASGTNRLSPSPAAVMMFIESHAHPPSCIFHGPALQRQCSLLIKQHRTRRWLLLPATADNYPPSPATGSHDCHPVSHEPQI